jgi:hypothetical protein
VRDTHAVFIASFVVAFDRAVDGLHRNPSAASPLTQSDEAEFFDQSTTTHFAAPSASSITSSKERLGRNSSPTKPTSPAVETIQREFLLSPVLPRVTDENIAHLAFTPKSCRNDSRGDRECKVMTPRQGPWSNISSGKVQPSLGRRSLCNHKQRLLEKRQLHHMSVERRRELFTRYLARS